MDYDGGCGDSDCELCKVDAEASRIRHRFYEAMESNRGDKSMNCPLYAYPTREDAMDRAEQTGMVALNATCILCGGWHLRDANSESEADEVAIEYRRALADKFPALAQQRGWSR